VKANKTKVRVRYAETDAMGFAYHSHHLSWFEMGRTEYMREKGYPYRSLEENDCYMPVVEIGCRYHAPAKYDDMLEIETRLEAMTHARIKFSYTINKVGENQLIATGFTMHACTDDKGIPKRIPSIIKEMVKDHEKG
jgi:acyl-CoA thioester hydrolase